MSIWLVLWFLLSFALLFFLGWTLVIAFKQKKSWKAYAKKNKLRYRSARMMEMPEVSGAVGEYTVSVFSSEHFGEEARGSRKLTAIEVQILTMLPVEAGVASGGLVRIVEGFGFKEEIRPDHKDWNQSYIASTEDRVVLESYLTKERVEALTTLMNVENAWVILVFRAGTALLRFDTPDPLSSPEKLEKLVSQMLKVAAVLELSKGEAGRLKTVKATKRQKEVEIKVDGKAMEAGGLSLEEDHVSDDDVSDKPASDDKEGE